MKTISRMYALMTLTSNQLKVVEGMTPKESFDVVIFRTKLQDKLRKLETILND